MARNRLLLTGGSADYGYVYRYGLAGAFDTALYAQVSTDPFQSADCYSTLLPDGTLITGRFPLASDSKGNRYVCDGNANYNNPTTIHKLAADGQELRSWDVIGQILTMFVGPDDNLYLDRFGLIEGTLEIRDSLYVYDPNGKLLRQQPLQGMLLGVDDKGRFYTRTTAPVSQFSNAGLLLIPDLLSGLSPFVSYPEVVASSADGRLAIAFEAGNVELFSLDVDIMFPDILPDQWAHDQIDACAVAGIVQGYPDGTYQPDVVVNRDSMAVFVSRALAGGDSHVPTAPAAAHFPDVAPDYWAFKYVEYAYANNIVQGYENGNYQPGDAVDRGQMAVFIARAVVTPTGDAGLASYTPPTTPTFPDVAAEAWNYKHVEYLKSRSVVSGYEDGKYHPEIACTRDQMAIFIARAFAL